LSFLELARITKDIIPKGVFNVITGRGSQSGQYLIDHPKLNKLAFTGSTEVGLTVGLAAAKKNYSLYLGIRGKIS
jgi:acyl-CoA reductase-like NAD-dependent aldehyde dehydrogenase